MNNMNNTAALDAARMNSSAAKMNNAVPINAARNTGRNIHQRREGQCHKDHRETAEREAARHASTAPLANSGSTPSDPGFKSNKSFAESRAKTNNLSNRGPLGFWLRLKSWETLTISCVSST